MFERLFDVISSLWDRIWPVKIIPCYDAGVHLRRGRYIRTLRGGNFYFCIPFLDDIITTSIVTTTTQLPYQTLITKDSKQVVASAVIKYWIDDVKPYLLEISDRDDVLNDVTMGAIRIVIKSHDLTDLDNCERDILQKVRREVNQYGFKVKSVTFSDLAPVKSIRLMQDSAGEE